MKFPAIYSFQVRRHVVTGEQTVFATEQKGTAKIENKKFSDVKSIFLDGNVRTAVIEIKEMSSEEQFKEHLYKLTQQWEVGNS